MNESIVYMSLTYLFQLRYFIVCLHLAECPYKCEECVTSSDTAVDQNLLFCDSTPVTRSCEIGYVLNDGICGGKYQVNVC
jgi:hypothetical protein